MYSRGKKGMGKAPVKEAFIWNSEKTSLVSGL